MCISGNDREESFEFLSLAKGKMGEVGTLPETGTGGNALATAVRSTLEMAWDLLWACLRAPLPGPVVSPGPGCGSVEAVALELLMATWDEASPRNSLG